MYHSKTVQETLSELNGSVNGISNSDADARLLKYGFNEFGKGKKRTLLDLIMEQFKNYILLLLIVAAAVSYSIGHENEAFGIGVVVVLNVLFGAALEYRADQSMKELRKLVETKVVVLRNGKKEQMESRLLVPGDIVFLESGIKVPADCRLLEAQNLEMNEASLTGESMAVRKNIEKVALQTPLAERSCMVFAGTFVAGGSGNAVVVATGGKTEVGEIEKKLADVQGEETTLEKTLADLGKKITLISFIIVGAIFIAGIAFGHLGVEELFIYSVSVIVAAVPEGMLTILSILLAIGVRNMATENALVRRLKAVETLGNVTFIATDKTGTITEGKMVLVKIYDGKLKDFGEMTGTEKIMAYSYLCNSTHMTDDGVVGDETDRAFVVAGLAKGIDVRKFRNTAAQVAFEPLDLVKRVMGGIYDIGNDRVAIVKGAPEAILDMCDRTESHEIGPAQKKELNGALSGLASQGMRVVAVAYRKTKAKRVPTDGLVFLGFLALHDPIRKGVNKTMAICREAGIRVLMITGDNVATAKRIAIEIGLGDGHGVVEWSELEKMTDVELDSKLSKIHVIARATPASKLRIVERLVKTEIVAVTGDGVNDAPALKKAHVSVVMGIAGTDIAKEVADLVLMDDDFATLEKAVEYGRRITGNIINFLRFQITTNIALVLLSIPYVLGITIFQPLHILWINLIIDGPPALTLGLEKPSREIMREKVVKKRSFIDLDFISNAGNMAIFMAGICIVIYFSYLKTDPTKAMTATFTTFVFMQAFNAFNCRSRTMPFYFGLFSNRWLVLAVAAVIAMQIAIVYFPLLQEVFGTVALSRADLIVVFIAAMSVLIVSEVGKMVRSKR